jgi:Tol biopolymer transport system component
VISHDGAKIAFTCTLQSRSNVFVIDAEGGGLTCLTTGIGESFGPTFSPDDRSIAYVQDADGREERYDIHVCALRSGIHRQLTFCGKAHNPVYSPDGGRIVFQSSRDGSEDLYSMTSEGEDVVRLTLSEHPPNREDPFGTRSLSSRFRPDGKQIAFISSRAVLRENRFDVYVMNANGSEQRRISHVVGSAAEPTYSPNGSALAFIVWTEEPIKRTVLWRVGANGSDAMAMEDSPGIDHLGNFRPDGRSLVFTSTRNGAHTDITRNWDLYLLNVASGAVERLTENAASDMNPVIHPDGRRVIYKSDQDGSSELYALTLPL